MNDCITIRPATPEDASLLFALFAEEKAAEFAPLGLPAAQLQPLLAMQYRGRQSSYAQAAKNPADRILCHENGAPVGRVLIDRQPECFRIMDIAVLAAWRNRGIAAEALRQLQAEAMRASLPLRLRVMKGNPAMRLYERLGFSMISSDEISREMQWLPVRNTVRSSPSPWARLAMGAAFLLCAAPFLHAQAVLSVTPTAAASTVAGTGAMGYSGDNGAATNATFASPGAVAYDAQGDLYIADTNNNVVREISTSGVVTTIAGNGQQGYSGDGGAAISAELNSPTGIAVDANGNLYIADSGNNRIREVSNGNISTVAGTGVTGYSGDGGAATGAELDMPSAVAVDASGNLYIADTDNQRIRKVSNGIISTVAGDGEQGFSGDGGAATSAALDTPTGVAVDAADNIFIADSHNNRIREVSNGNISTVAGSGPLGLADGYSGDGGSATAAQLAKPTGVAMDAAGNIYIADTNNNRLREVGNGGISTVAGTGVQGYAGDGGAATSAVLNQPSSVAINSTGNAAIADAQNERVRGVTLPTLTYASQGVGIASSPQDVTIANTGSGTLTVQTLNVTGSFAAASGGTCSALPISLGAGQSCTQAIVFEPTAAGASQGSVVVGGSDVAPQTVLLSGASIQSAAIPQLISSVNPSAFGTSVTFTATVGAGSSSTPTGTITFYDGSTALQAVTMSGGSASYTTSSLSVGAHSITAAYGGNSAWEAKTSQALTQAVQQAVPSITLTSSASAVLLENPIILTAVVTSGSGTPTGTVTFMDGATAIGSAPLNAGQATISVSTLGAGAHNITAVYSGSADFTSVTSAAVSEQVEDFSLNLANGSATSVSVAPGGTATYTLVISPVGSAAFPQSIQFSANGLPQGATATFSPASIPAGSGTTTITLTIQVPNTTAALRAPEIWQNPAPMYFGLALFPFADIRRNHLLRETDEANNAKERKPCRLQMLLMMAVISLAAFVGLTGCGSNTGYFVHPSQNYTITVTGTAGALSHSTTVQLNVK